MAMLIIVLGVVAPAAVGAASADWVLPLGQSSLATLPDGSVAALTSSAGVSHVTRAGSLDWTLPDAAVHQGPIADADGNIYWTSYDVCNPNCTARLISVTEAGVARWSTTIPHYTTVPIKDGPDGLIYISTGEIMGISKADGHIVFSSKLEQPSSSTDVLSPFSGGVAVLENNGLTYFTTTGATLKRYPLDGQFGRRAAGNPAGVVYVVRPVDCNAGGFTTLMAFTSSAQLWEKTIANGCWGSAAGRDAPYIAALPDGGVVVNLSTDGTFGFGETVFNTDGTVRWQSKLALPTDAWRFDAVLVPLVDASGNIAIADRFAFPCHGLNTCTGVTVQYFGSATGASSLAPHSWQTGDPAPESFSITLDSAAIASGQTYLSMRHGVYSSTNPDDRLSSASTAGVDRPWPSSAFWGSLQPRPAPTLTLKPAEQTLTPSSTGTVVAKLSSGTEPAPNSLVNFAVVSGPNSGTRGLCSPSTCRTDASGSVTYHYVGAGSTGDDTIRAFLDSNGNGSLDTGDPLVTAVIHWALPTVSPYVALGDSYSSGEGLGPYVDGTDQIGLVGTYTNLCHRSLDAYGPLLSKDANRPLPIFAACSGAITNDYFQPNSEGNYSQTGSPVPAQRDALSSSTKSVTITMGGNDAGFANVLATCVYARVSLIHFGGSGCSKLPWLVESTDRAIAALGGGRGWTTAAKGTAKGQPIHPIAEVIRDILAQAPNAHVYIADYPQLFGNPSKFKECKVGTMDLTFMSPTLPHIARAYISSADAKWINAVSARYDNVIKDAVKSVGSPRVTYVRASRSFQTHRLCDSGASWVQGVDGIAWSLDKADREVYPSSFHPTRAGQNLGYRSAFSASGMTP